MKTKLIEKLPENFDLDVPCLSKGQALRHEGLIVERSTGANGLVFAKAGKDGPIYVVGSRLSQINLSASWRVNDCDRRVWCRLAGVRMSALKALIRSRSEAAAKREEDRAINQLKSHAARKGYKLVKIRKAA